MLEESIYDISSLKPIGFGGTKTVYKIDDDWVVFGPNKIDGEGLVQQWPRITDDEYRMSKLLKTVGVPALELNTCQIKLKDGRTMVSNSSKSFFSYTKNGIYIIDHKDPPSSQWPCDGNMSLIEGDDKMDFGIWTDILEPVVNDILKLADSCYWFGMDAFNLAFVSKESNLHSGCKYPFEVRMFMFDFTSKHHPYNFQNRDKVSFSEKYYVFKNLVEAAVWQELAPGTVCLNNEQEKFVNKLSSHFQDRFKNSPDDVYEPPIPGCTIQ
ncbi:MAG: hypothetical protein Satyrvirus7_20 [Satyrvirus sp.]|uniref:Uncharacterized protein n=1 Tax=Satyrvirus sp. TaxID=2487771 RepID=A0A3G5ADC7_9VIRU|nr:MAG: hypothetical protein Satyrvirus7_20 [Satyrvirus sp.]